MATKPLIILTAGGTGGHVYPAEALAEELLKRGYELALVTDKRGKDNYKGKLGEIKNYAVYAGGLVGKSKFTKIKNLFKTGIGVLQAAYILLKRKPACVVGFGGYASFPCSMAAILLGVDLVIHEQNSVMSRTNRFLSKYATLVAQSFKDVKFINTMAKNVLTGMPIRKAVLEARDIKYPLREEVFQILILGGSQGAKVFSEIVPKAIKKLDKNLQKKIKIYQQARQDDIDGLKKAYKGCGAEVVLSSFFSNMKDLYASSNVVVSRAGASSVSEILAVGRPSILVPLPIAADDHQTGNAKGVEAAGAGYLIKQEDFSEEKLAELIDELVKDNTKLEEMSKNAKNEGIVDAAERFANHIEKEILGK